MSNVQNPGPGVWNCCIAKPARVLEFDDGSAIIVCQACSTMVPQRRIHPLPVGESFAWFTPRTRGGQRPFGASYDVQCNALARAEVLYSAKSWREPSVKA